MTSVCYFFAYLFEIFISCTYFQHKFERKAGGIRFFLCCSVSFILQYTANYIGNANINLASFLVCNFLLCLLCYSSGVFKSILHSILLASMMLLTELCVFYIFRLIPGIDISAHNTDSTVLLFQSICTKLFYFIVSYIIVNLSSKEKNGMFFSPKSCLLFLLPVASILLLLGIVYITETYKTENSVYSIFSLSAILLLYSNIVVFWIHEQTIKTQTENTELQLQKQKTKIDSEYYALLQEQYENSNILIHDIKRHLLSIKELSSEHDYQGISNYIDSLYNSYQINRIMKYSDNKLVNAIINRYAAKCSDKNISFYCDVRNVDFSFIRENDLTAVLDNMLENAVSASEKSEDKFIELTIKNSNKNFTVIKTENSCSFEPEIQNGKLVTSKKNKSIHGFGIKSIEKIAKDYCGNVDFGYDSNKKVFSFSVVLKSLNE